MTTLALLLGPDGRESEDVPLDLLFGPGMGELLGPAVVADAPRDAASIVLRRFCDCCSCCCWWCTQTKTTLRPLSKGNPRSPLFFEETIVYSAIENHSALLTSRDILLGLSRCMDNSNPDFLCHLCGPGRMQAAQAAAHVQPLPAAYLCQIWRNAHGHE